MNKDELIKRFNELGTSPDLGVVASLALAKIDDADEVAIDDYGDTTSADTQGILQTYRIRQKRLRTTGTTIRGFDETIAMLEKVKSARVNVIIVHVDKEIITVLSDPSGSLVGCYFGKEAGHDPKE